VYCDPDPTFSKRPSDPKPKNLITLVQTVKKNNCDFGVAFDGDGDRAVIVDNTGQILTADQTGIILGKYGLKKKKGTIIVNVECSKSIKEQLEPLGYSVKQIPVGHTFLTLESKQTHALLGIESSGHLIIPEYFLFDDALVIPLKIAQILDSIKNLYMTWWWKRQVIQQKKKKLNALMTSNSRLSNNSNRNYQRNINRRTLWMAYASISKRDGC